MSDSALAIVDGALVPLARAVLPVTDPAFTVGWSVFETFVAQDGEPERWSRHVARLRESCREATLPEPDDAQLLAETRRLAATVPGACRVRITLTGGGHRVITATPLDPGVRHRPLRAARGVHRDEPYLGGRVKHGSRAPWIVAVRRAAVDEVLLVDEGGRFTEGTTSGILAVIDGRLWTAPHDGRILPSTTVSSLVQAAAELGVPVVREGPPASGPWDALYVASVTRGIAPVIELDGVSLPAWEPIGRALAEHDGGG